MAKIKASSQELEMNRVGAKILEQIADIKKDAGDGKWPKQLEDKGFTEEKELYGEMAEFLRDVISQAFEYFVMQFINYRHEPHRKAIRLDKNKKLATLEIYVDPNQWDFSFKIAAEFDDDVSIVHSVLDHFKIKLEQEEAE